MYFLTFIAIALVAYCVIDFCDVSGYKFINTVTWLLIAAIVITGAVLQSFAIAAWVPATLLAAGIASGLVAQHLVPTAA